MLAAIAEGTSRISGFLDGEDTRATAARSPRWASDRSPGSERAHRAWSGPARVARSVRAARLRQRRHRDATAGRSARRAVLRFDPCRRRVAVAPADAPRDRSAGPDGRTHRVGGRRPATVAHQRRQRAARNRLHAAGCQRPDQVGGAAGRAVRKRRDRVHEPRPTRDYTERMLRAFGWPVEFSPGQAALRGGHALRATDIAVPADFSSAAFFIVAASVVPGSELLPARGRHESATDRPAACAAGNGCGHHRVERQRKWRRARRRPARPARAPARHRCTGGRGARHDRRVPGVVRGRERRIRT